MPRLGERRRPARWRERRERREPGGQAAAQEQRQSLAAWPEGRTLERLAA